MGEREIVMVFTLVWVMHVVLRSREQGSEKENLESLNLSPKEVKRSFKTYFRNPKRPFSENSEKPFSEE